MQFMISQTISNDWVFFGFFLIGIIFLIGMSGFLLKLHFISANASRIFVHVFVGIACSLSPFLFENNSQPVLLGFIFLSLNLIALKINIFKGIHSQDRNSYGTIYFPMAYLIMATFFWEYTFFLIISLSILSIADPIATIVGKSISNPVIIKIGDDNKSIQGSAAMLFCSGIIIYCWSSILFPNGNNISTIIFIILTAGMATIAEMISFRGSDNLSIPLLSFFTMHSLTIKDPYFEIMFLCILFVFVVAFNLKMITTSGFFGAIAMGFLIATYGSYKYLAPIGVFFILSSILSKIFPDKSNEIKRGSKRDIIQVFANGGIPLLLCIINAFTKYDSMIYLLFLSSVAAATADTWATELGKLSRRNPVSIVNFQVMEPGLSGGITIIGTIGSLMGASVIGLIGLIIGLQIYDIYGIIIIGFISGILDSVLGATLQAKYQTKDGKIIEYRHQGEYLVSGYHWMNNDLVNLLNTASAPLLMYLYIQLINL